MGGHKDLYTWLLGYRTEISFLYRHNYCLTRKFRWICIFFYFKRKSTCKQSRKKHVKTENTAFQYTPVYNTYTGRLVSHVMTIWTKRSWVWYPCYPDFWLTIVHDNHSVYFYIITCYVYMFCLQRWAVYIYYD